MVECCRRAKTKHSENIQYEWHIFSVQISHELILYWNRVCENHYIPDLDK